MSWCIKGDLFREIKFSAAIWIAAYINDTSERNLVQIKLYITVVNGHMIKIHIKTDKNSYDEKDGLHIWL